MKLISFVPVGTKIRFLQYRKAAIIASLVLCIASIGLYATKGLNYGIDFRGGILLEIRTQGPADHQQIRQQIGELDLGNFEIQGFGEPTDVLIRIETQPGGAPGQQKAIDAVRKALGENIDYRRQEFVGPTVSGELVQAGIMAVLLALVAMLVYIWFRFEWQFGVGAVVALTHDVLMTIGMFSVVGLEFNLTTVAAILTIAGYSINDTVVVYDRVRENLRKYKVMKLEAVLDLSLNDTLSRTLLTSITTMIALLILYIWGGEVIKGFALAMIWGVLVGTYSSIFVAAPLLIQMNLRAQDVALDEDDAATAS